MVEKCEETCLAHEAAGDPSVASAASSRQPGVPPDSGIRLDRLLAEIEERIAELKEMVTRLALVQSLQSSEKVLGTDDEAAVVWMREALDDIAAAALGIQLTSHEGFVQTQLAAVQDLLAEAAQEPESGSTG